MCTRFSGSIGTRKSQRFFRLNRNISGRFRLKISGLSRFRFPGSTGKYAGGYSGFIWFRLNHPVLPLVCMENFICFQMGPIQPGNGTGTFPQFEYANSQCLLDMFRFILAVLPKNMAIIMLIDDV